MLAEFYSSRFRFKQSLKGKWENNELKINADHNKRTRTLYEHVTNLERSTQTFLSKKHFEDLRAYVSKVDRNTDTIELKQKITDLIQKYLKIVESLESIEQYYETGKDTSFLPAKTTLQRFQVLNNKPSHSICIIGLEKCGKSTFINGLIGFELLPAASERCTQISTVLKPMLVEDATLFAVVEFYDDANFEILIKQMVRKSDEQEQTFQSRKIEVVTKRQELLSKFPNGQQIFKVNGVDGNADNQRNIHIKALHQYIAHELYVNIIKAISIYTEKLPGM